MALKDRPAGPLEGDPIGRRELFQPGLAGDDGGENAGRQDAQVDALAVGGAVHGELAEEVLKLGPRAGVFGALIQRPVARGAFTREPDGALG